MKLGEFIKNFSHNNVVRLLYRCQGGHKTIYGSWDDVTMDWEIIKQQNIFRHFINNEILGLATICYTKYPEALNIVIEYLEDQPELIELNDDKTNTESL